MGGRPRCGPEWKIIGPVCEIIASILGDLAYIPLFQEHLFQADFFRDPTLLNTTAYKANSQMADWNNEFQINATYKENFLKTEQYVMVKALKDTMIFPNEGEHWGAFAPGQYHHVLSMNE